MNDFLLLPLQDLIGGGAFLVLLIFMIYDKFFSKRAKEHRLADKDLISVFEATINRLEINQKDMQKQMDEMELELKEIKKENEIMVKIFQGRDEGIINYQKRGLELMDKVDNVILPLLIKIDNKIK